jgi:predicted transcriptional regulator
VSTGEREGLLETLHILADPELMVSIREGLADIEAGRVHPEEEVWGEA